MFNISKEMIIVLVIVLIIFGPKQLPQLGKMLGKTMKGLREGMDDVETGQTEPPPQITVSPIRPSTDLVAELERLRAENARLCASAAENAAHDASGEGPH
jgi:sec-independent protein translocase protein TatA